MSLRVITGQALERSAVILMARIVGAGGTPITQASVDTLTYEVGFVDTPPELRGPMAPTEQEAPARTSGAGESLVVAETISDALQTGPAWRVTAAAPATAGQSALYVDPLKGLLPVGRSLDFATGAATLTQPAVAGARELSVAITGEIPVGARAVAGTPAVPAASPWKVDAIGYNFRMGLEADELPEIPIGDYPRPRYYVVSVELTPTVGDVFGWEYRLETYHRLHGKWEPQTP